MRYKVSKENYIASVDKKRGKGRKCFSQNSTARWKDIVMQFKGSWNFRIYTRC